MGSSVVFVVGRGDRGDSGCRRRDAGPGNRDNHKMTPFLRLMLNSKVRLKKLEGYGDAIGINGDIHGDASFLKIEDF